MCIDCFQEFPSAGLVGPPGSDGADGTSSFVYKAWAKDDIGTGFTLDPLDVDDTYAYMAILITDTEIVSPVLSDFSGEFFPFRGPTGPTGPAGSSASGTKVTVVTNVVDLSGISSPSNLDLAFVLFDRSLYRYNSGSTTWIRQYGNGWNSNPASTVTMLGGGGSDSLTSGVFKFGKNQEIVTWNFTATLSFGTAYQIQVNLSSLLDVSPAMNMYFSGFYFDVDNDTAPSVIYWITTGKILTITRQVNTPSGTPFAASNDANINISGYFLRSL